MASLLEQISLGSSRRRSSPTVVLSYLVVVPLGLWLGGLVTLVLFVSVMFTRARAVAADAAPVLFNAFERYQLVLAAGTLLALTLWRWAGRSRTKNLTLLTTLAATVLSVVQIALITPRIERYRNTDPAAFQRFHQWATVNYSVISLIVLAALVLAITATRRELLLRLAAR